MRLRRWSSAEENKSDCLRYPKRWSVLVEAGSLFVQKNLPGQEFLIGHGTQWVINTLKFCVKLYLYVCASVFF